MLRQGAIVYNLLCISVFTHSNAIFPPVYYSPQAFSICVACLDGKIADRKGYEYLRKFTSSAQAEAAEREENNAATNEAFYNNGQTVRICFLLCHCFFGNVSPYSPTKKQLLIHSLTHVPF